MNIYDTIFKNHIAVSLGNDVNGAIMLSVIHHWVLTNKKKNINFFEGRHWTYNTRVGWQKIVPYFSVDQIQRILTKLHKNGYILKGKFNQKNYDSTCWYTLTEKSWKLYEEAYSSQAEDTQKVCKEENSSDFTNLENRDCEIATPHCEIATPIPYNTHNNTKYEFINSNKEKEIDKEKEDGNVCDSLFAEIEDKPKKSRRKKIVKSDEYADGSIAKRYAEFVWLTENQYNSLLEKYGSEVGREWAIATLNSYKQRSKREYESDLLPLVGWVKKEYIKEMAKHNNDIEEIKRTTKTVPSSRGAIWDYLNAQREGQEDDEQT